MAISSRHILSQGPTLSGIGRTALTALTQEVETLLGRAANQGPIDTPTPELTATYAPRPPALVRDYIRHVGGDPAHYKNTLPPHLFPQWAFGLASQTLTGMPYPLMRVLNGGCRMTLKGPLPADEPLQVSANLQSIDDNGRRAVLCQRVLTGSPSAPDALEALLYAVVPLKSAAPGDPTKKNKEKPRVPDEVREVGFWQLAPDAGLDFAKLTGDFNPVHWVRPYAQAFGFRNTILHGFATMARAYEGLHTHTFKGSRTMTMFDVKFTRPLVLPASVGLYLGPDNSVYVGDAPGGPAYMVGHYKESE